MSTEELAVQDCALDRFDRRRPLGRGCTGSSSTARSTGRAPVPCVRRPSFRRRRADAHTVAWAPTDGTVTVDDADHHPLPPHGGRVRQLAWRRDGRRATGAGCWLTRDARPTRAIALETDAARAVLDLPVAVAVGRRDVHAEGLAAQRAREP